MYSVVKYPIYAWLLLMVMPFCALSKDSSAEDLMKKGNAAYAKNEFKEAAAAYRQVLDEGYESASVYFNLGNANYKLAEISQAILNYEKALKLNPSDDDIKLNLKLANLKIADRMDVVPEFFLTKWWKGFIYLISLSTLSVLTVVCFISGFMLLIAYLFLIASAPKKSTFYAGVVVLSLGLIFLIMAGVQSHYVNSNKEGIVFAGAADIKSGPDSKQKTLFVIHDGTKVRILDRDAEWIRVMLPNGNGGWMKFSDIKEI